MFSCSESFWFHANITPVVNLKKKNELGVKVDLQSMSEQGAKVVKLRFSFVDFTIPLLSQ